MKKLLSFKYISAIYQLLFLFISMRPGKVHSAHRYRYFLILSSALNYVVSNFIVHEFENAVYKPEKKRRVGLREANRVSDYLEDKRDEALTDDLTTLYNRKAYEKALPQLKGSHLSVIIFDLDHFKRINDNYGHDEGDRILRELGKLVKNIVSDVEGEAFRYGGEEFVIVLPKQSKKTATILARTLRHEVAQSIDAQGNPVTISVGVASGRVPTKLIKIADKALYRAKRNGRNQVCVG